MSGFGVIGFQDTTSTGFKTMAESIGIATTRHAVYDWIFGTRDTPADTAMTYDMNRLTAAGTASAGVENPLDPAMAPALIVWQTNTTIEPTIGGTATLTIAANQRASFRWVAAPGSEIVMAAATNDGLAARVLSTGYTGQTDTTVMWREGV